MLSVNLWLLFGSFCGTARRYLNLTAGCKTGTPCRAASLRCCYSFYYIICSACVNGYFDEYYAGISSLLFTLFSLPLFLSILLHFIQAFPLTHLHSHLLSQGLSEIKKRRIFPFLSCTPTKKAAASNLPAAAYLIIIAFPDYPLRFISITLRCHPGYLPQKHPSSFRCATYLFHLFPWRQPSAVVPGRSLWCRSGSARVLQ